MAKQQLVHIPLNIIHPHPKNPRKDLGDLTELAAGIKEKGILQNLTIVPIPEGEEYAGEYWAVIGHRRRAAAELAGLEDAPCVVSDMDEKEQVATMLAENMQREDLTPREQAHGMQMMMDLGETVADISARTGFSETTVRHRVKLLELNDKNFAESEERGATLQEYVQLEQIKDLKLRNSVLDKVGTDNFNNALQAALNKELTAEYVAALTEALEVFATKVEEKPDGYRHGEYYSMWNIPKDRADWDLPEKPEDVGEVDYVYKVDSYSIYLYNNRVEAETEVAVYEPTPEEIERDRRKNGLKELAARAYKLRTDFVKEVAGLKKKSLIIQKFLLDQLIDCDRWNGLNLDEGDFMELVGIHTDGEDGEEYEEDEVWEANRKKLNELFTATPERIMLFAAYSCLDDDDRENYSNWCNQHEPNEELDRLYDFLIALGYKMSDEEKQWRDGTHELYAQPDPEEEPDEEDLDEDAEEITSEV